MNESAFQKFLATGDFTVTEDAAPKKDPTLAAHDKRFHPQGYKEGDSCKFREALAKGDKSDAALAAAEAVEARKKATTVQGEGIGIFYRDPTSIGKKEMKVGDLVRARGALGEYYIVGSDGKGGIDLMEAEGTRMFGTDGSDLILVRATSVKPPKRSLIDKYLSMSDDGFAKDVLSLDEKGIKRLEGEIKGFLSNSIPNADVKVVKDQPEKGQFAIAVAGVSDWDLQRALSSYPRTGYWSFTDRYEGNNVKLDGDDKPRKYAFLSFKAKEDKPAEPSKQEKIAKLQKLHEDYNKWFETADRGDIHAWLKEEEKWVKDLKDALEGLEIGKDIQWDSDRRNFYSLSDKKDKPTFNPDNRFHMAEDDDLWRRRNEGDADAKVLADLVMDYNRENKWGFSGEDLDAYVKAFKDMDNDKFPKGLPEQSDRNEARKEKFASVISSRPELIRLYIIERLTDANYHREVKALSEGRYDEVLSE